MEGLSNKARTGTLTPAEQIELDRFDRLGLVLANIQSRARQRSRRTRRGLLMAIATCFPTDDAEDGLAHRLILRIDRHDSDSVSLTFAATVPPSPTTASGRRRTLRPSSALPMPH
jgi:hypothetical protein